VTWLKNDEIYRNQRPKFSHFETLIRFIYQPFAVCTTEIQRTLDTTT